MENRYLDRRKKARQQLGLHEAARAICHPALPICDSYLLSWCRGQGYFGPMPARSYRSAPSVLSSSYPSWNKFNGQWLSRRQSNVLGAPPGALRRVAFATPSKLGLTFRFFRFLRFQRIIARVPLIFRGIKIIRPIDVQASRFALG